MKPAATVAAAFAFLALLAGSTEARAFCRSRTCNPNDAKQHCQIVDNCVMSGHPLYWKTSCVSFDAQADGSMLRGIDADSVTAVVELAFTPWLEADCGDGSPSMKVGTFGPVVCDQVENPDPKHPNQYNRASEKGANVVMFRDDGWPYPGSQDAYGLTTMTFDVDTGEIIDADIEINSTDFDVAVDGSGTDLQSILTHEVGHFLGMAHAASANQTATMRTSWNGIGTDLRNLSDDDIAGICAIYPPDRVASSSCTPLNGFASECHVPAAKPDAGGCSVAFAGSPRSRTNVLYAGGCALALWSLRRRRRAQQITSGAATRRVHVRCRAPGAGSAARA